MLSKPLLQKLKTKLSVSEINLNDDRSATFFYFYVSIQTDEI